MSLCPAGTSPWLWSEFMGAFGDSASGCTLALEFLLLSAAVTLDEVPALVTDREMLSLLFVSSALSRSRSLSTAPLFPWEGGESLPWSLSVCVWRCVSEGAVWESEVCEEEELAALLATEVMWESGRGGGLHVLDLCCLSRLTVEVVLRLPSFSTPAEE